MSSGSDGSIVAAPVWKAFMARVLSGTPVETFKEPDKTPSSKAIINGYLPVLQSQLIDKRTGMVASNNTPTEFVETKNIYNNHCILYYIDKDNPLGQAPTNPASDPQFNNWESAVINWAKKNKQGTTITTQTYPTTIASSTATSTATSTEESIIITTTTTPEINSSTLENIKK